MRTTPLYEQHCKLGGKIIDFNGWALPVRYSGIIEEHLAVRNTAGLFDVSHMGEIIVKGADATKYIQKLITNDIILGEGKKSHYNNDADYEIRYEATVNQGRISGLAHYKNTVSGQVVYSPMCYHNGGVVDDLLVYKFNDEEYLLVVNASNTDKDFEWMKANLEGCVKISNVSGDFAQLALQGPKAEMILQKLTTTPLQNIKFYRFIPEADLEGIKALISRTGYTGEDGFEIYIRPEDAPELWNKLLQAGEEEGLVPVGLGARDTLRFEAALPLYGQEISQDISPLEAGLDTFVKLNKDDFIGKDALARQKAVGLQRTLVGFEMIDRGIPRSHYDVQADGKTIGFVTTGGFTPSLRKNLGLALIDRGYAAEDTEISIVIRDRALAAKVVRKPFYNKKYFKAFVNASVV